MQWQTKVATSRDTPWGCRRLVPPSRGPSSKRSPGRSSGEGHIRYTRTVIGAMNVTVTQHGRTIPAVNCLLPRAGVPSHVTVGRPGSLADTSLTQLEFPKSAGALCRKLSSLEGRGATVQTRCNSGHPNDQRKRQSGDAYRFVNRSIAKSSCSARSPAVSFSPGMSQSSNGSLTDAEATLSRTPGAGGGSRECGGCQSPCGTIPMGCVGT